MDFYGVSSGMHNGRHNERVCVIRRNTDAGNYDSDGDPVVWMQANPYFPGSDSHTHHEKCMREMARVIAEALTAAQPPREIDTPHALAMRAGKVAI